MNAKKIMAAMAVLIMAVSCIAVVPADESDAGSTYDISDLKVGEVTASKMTAEVNMNDVLDKMGPAINLLVNEIAVYGFGISSGQFIEMVKMMGYEKSATILSNIAKNPEGYDLTKADLLRLINDTMDLLRTGINVSEIDFNMSIESITATKKLAENEYRTIVTNNATIGLTLVFSSTSSSIPSIILRDAKINIRDIQETTLDLDTLKFATTSKGETNITFSGQSNFINDKATEISDMFKILDKVQDFKLSFDMKASASLKITPDAGFKLPTTLDTEVDTNINLEMQSSAEMASDNSAIQAVIGSQIQTFNESFSLPVSVALVRADNIIPADHYLVTLYATNGDDGKEPVGYIYCSKNIYGFSFEANNISFVMIVDVNTMRMTANISYVEDPTPEEEPTELAAMGATTPQDIFEYLAELLRSMPSGITILATEDTFKIYGNGETIDLSKIVKWVNDKTSKYGATEVLTTEELDKFEKEVSKTAYALNYNILGFTGKQLNNNPDPEPQCPLSLNAQLAIIVAIALVIVIIILAYSYRKNRP